MKWIEADCQEWHIPTMTLSGQSLVDFHYGIPGRYTFFRCTAKDLSEAHERLEEWKQKQTYKMIGIRPEDRLPGKSVCPDICEGMQGYS